MQLRSLTNDLILVTLLTIVLIGGADISFMRNSIVGHINDVLCQFSLVGAVPKLNFLKSYCNSLYGWELWNLFHAAISDVYIQHGVKVYVESGRPISWVYSDV